MARDARVAALWRSRARAEAGVGVYARSLARDLRSADALDAVVSLAVGMAEDERRHARICLEVAARYDDRSTTRVVPRGTSFAPIDRIASVPTRATLASVAMCCIGEAIACVWIDASRDETGPSWLRAIGRKHLSDEVRHARVGWAHLASSRVTDRDRATIARWLPGLLRANVRSWLAFDDRWPSEGFPEHGLPSHAETASCVREAIDAIVLPGLERAGVDVSSARPYVVEMLNEAER